MQIILFPTWGVFIFQIGEFPDWARVVFNNTFMNAARTGIGNNPDPQKL